MSNLFKKDEPTVEKITAFIIGDEINGLSNLTEAFNGLGQFFAQNGFEYSLVSGKTQSEPWVEINEQLNVVDSDREDVFELDSEDDNIHRTTLENANVEIRFLDSIDEDEYSAGAPKLNEASRIVQDFIETTGGLQLPSLKSLKVEFIIKQELNMSQLTREW